VYAFERETGKARWKVAVPYGVPTDIRRLGSNLYMVSLSDELMCLDLESGTVNWISPSGAVNDGFFLPSSPSVGDGRVFFGDLDGGVSALDAASGNVLWKRSLGARISTSVFAEGRRVTLGTADGHLYGLDATTGATLADLVTEPAPSGPIVRAADSLLVFLGAKSLGSFGLSLDRPRWVQKSVADWSSSRPYVWRGMALAGDELGQLVGFRLSDGARRWSRKLAGVIRGVGASSDALYIGTLKGNVYALSP